jgi:heme A synthase
VIPHAAEIATVIEFTHRATTGIAFFAVVAMAVWAFRAFRGEPVARAAVWSLVLIVTEALLGAGLVLFKYVGTDVSPARVVYLSAHLINTLLMLAAMALTAWWAAGRRAMDWSSANAKWFGTAIIAGLTIAVTGAITALSDTLFPAKSLTEGLAADFASTSSWLVRLRIVHPVVAALAGIYIVLVAARIGRRLSMVVIGLVVLQMAAGMLNLYLLAPIWMQLVHLLLADLLWIALVLFTAEALEVAPAREHEPRLQHAR